MNFRSIDEPDADITLRESRRTIRIVQLALLVIVLLLLFLFWRIEGDRAERFQAYLLDGILPAIEIGQKPGQVIADIGATWEKFVRSGQDHDDLEMTRRKLREWQAHAQLLEQENAALRKIVNLAGRPENSVITAPVIADTRSPFHNSILVRIGSRNGVGNGWIATDGIGVVGHVTSVGDSVSRVLLLIDSSSRIPARLDPAGTRVLVIGNNTLFPSLIQFGSETRIPDRTRVITSGDAGVFPPGYLIGSTYTQESGDPRLIPAADIASLSHVTLIVHELPSAENLDSTIIGDEPAGIVP